MYAAIKAIYENGQIIFQEEPPTTEKTNVIVMFIKEQSNNNQHTGVKIGSLSGKGYSIPDDFNEPLNDLAEYM
ncbi:hypothetical protein DOJK_01437 [Patescibacteria group bacterium]|nr:hypothetical protein DOJK_01437 [Patescibacteria group bacterium]